MKRVALFAVISLLAASPAPADDPKIPDTPAGKSAAAFIQAFQKGDEAAFQQYEQEHRAASAARRRPLKDRVSEWLDRRAEWGDIKIQPVLSSGDLDVMLVVIPSKLDGWFHLAFELEPEPPHGVWSISVEGPVDPKSSAAANKQLDPDRRTKLVERVADELANAYVYEDVGRAMAADIRRRLAAGEYDDAEYSYKFARRLTRDLRAVCHDKHLSVIPRIPVTRRGERDTTGDRMAPKPEQNYGFQNVEILPGNVGYVKFNMFEHDPAAQHAAAAAMAFVANTDALILDLTENGGGSGAMIEFLSGYFFDEPVHLNAFENRSQGFSRDTYSAAEVPGQRYGQDKPVYVLTSSYTFSAAEEFAYNLKHLKRAQIVGETTGGGAHPVSFRTLNKYFILKIPDGRSINPVTKTNWEGVGVIPDVPVPADQAKETARKLAIGA